MCGSSGVLSQPNWGNVVTIDRARISFLSVSGYMELFKEVKFEVDFAVFILVLHSPVAALQMLAADSHQFVVFGIGQLGALLEVSEDVRSVLVLVQVGVEQNGFDVENGVVRVAVLVHVFRFAGFDADDFSFR